MVKWKRPPRRERRVRVQVKWLGESLLAIGQATGCPLFLAKGRYYLSYRARRRMHSAYRQRRRHW